MRVPYLLAGAMLSPCGQFRYRLWRIWNTERPRLLWIMLNPSTADAELDDQTILTIVDIARANGFGGIEVVNAYAFRATDPRDLRLRGYPIAGSKNDELIWTMARVVDREGGRVVCAWGNHIQPARADRVLGILADAQLCALPMLISLTKLGQPRHPLYCKRDVKLIEWCEYA